MKKIRSGRSWRAVTCAVGMTVMTAFGAEEQASIRYAARAPYAANGSRVAAVWEKADVCTRFIEVVNNNVARHQAEARLLFDDKNLYVSLWGAFDAKYIRGDRKNGRGSVNNFEFMIRPDGGEPLHIIADEFERLYVERSKSELRDSGVTMTAFKGKDSWTANLTIPFGAIGISAPTGELAAKVGIFRNNVNVHERETLYSNRMIASGFTPNNYNYGVSDRWADMTFTRKPGVSRRIVGPAFGARINLFPDPDFNVPNSWSACGKTTYGETMAMSGEWIYRSAGKDYQFLQCGARQLKPKTRYTLVVKARSFGEGSGLRIVQIARGKNGRTHEGTYVSSLTPLGPDMHEYFLPFTTDADESWSMVFYKVDNKRDDTGIEIASARCYEGEISSFEVRKLSRPGRMGIVKGTEIPVVPNPIGRFAKPLKVLAFVTSKYQNRAPEEIFAGTGAALDVLQLSGKASDVYSTWGDTKAISDRAAKGTYDLVMVPARGAGMIGKEMAKHIRTCVEKGGGLYIDAQPADLGLLAPIVRDAKGGKLGKGRVVTVKTATRNAQYLAFENDRRAAVSLFPSDVPRMRVAAAAWRAAAGTLIRQTAASERKTETVYAGKTWTFTKKLDANGGLLDWVETSVPVAGPCLGVFNDDGRVSSLSVTGDVTGVTFAWAFRDFSGRVLAKGEMPAENRMKFLIPREKLYTNFGGLRLSLWKDGREIDVRGEGVFVRTNDRKRLMDDYTPSMWPGEDVAENRQLEEIGIRSTILPCGGGSKPAQTLASGIASGSSWLGGGDVFCSLYPPKGNVRVPSFNTKQYRESKPKDVRKAAKATYEYGFLNGALCDEPNLARPGTDFEVDAHPENLAEYRIRMAKKYGTIAEYNRRHQTAHASFADLNQTRRADARKAKNYAEFIEWRNFNVDRWCEIIKLVSDAARSVDDVPFTMCNSFGQSALSGNDYYKLLTKAGLDFSTEYTHTVYFGRNPISNYDEFIRSFRPDMRCWGWTGYFYTHGHARFLPWWTACHRYGGFAWYAATAPGYNIVDSTTYARTIDGEDLRQSLIDSRMLDGFGKVLTCWPWAPRDVAIYYSHDSLLLSTILGTETKNGEIATVGPLHDYMYSRQGAQYVVETLLYQHDFVAPEQIVTQDRLATVRALLVPRVNAMSDAEVAAVKRYLARGGRMMCDALPGDYDELGVRRATNPFAGSDGITVYGKNFDDQNGDCRAAVQKFLASAGATQAIVCERAVAHLGREAMHYVSGDADLYAVIREGGKDDDALDYRFAKKGHVYDVQMRQYLGETDRATAKTKINEGTAFAVLPARIDGIVISAPALLARGGSLAADFTITQARSYARAQDWPAYVLHVEMVPPSGKVRFHFKRNLMTQGGKAHLDFPVAFNDEKGAWKLRVTEPLTGVVAERRIAVE